MLPKSEFADMFRAHVMPRLRGAIDGYALLVALGSRTFTEALTAVRAEAHVKGAGYLPVPHYEALLDWTAAALLDAAVKADARCAAHDLAMAHVHGDVERCDQAIRAAFNGD